MNYVFVVPVILAVGAFRFVFVGRDNLKLIVRLQRVSLL